MKERIGNRERNGKCKASQLPSVSFSPLLSSFFHAHLSLLTSLLLWHLRSRWSIHLHLSLLSHSAPSSSQFTQPPQVTPSSSLLTFGTILTDSGGCPIQCKMFSSIHSLYPLNAVAPPPPIMTTQNVSRHCWMSPEGQNHQSLLRTTALFERRSSMADWARAWVRPPLCPRWALFLDICLYYFLRDPVIFPAEFNLSEPKFPHS